jgi:hypothetical protein
MYYWNRERTAQQETLLKFYLFCLAGGLLLLGKTIWNALGVGKAVSRTTVAVGVASLAIVAMAAVWIATPAKYQPKMILDKKEVVAGQGDYSLKIAEMPNETVVVRYSVDGAAPVEMSALLDSMGSVHFDVDAGTPRGVYRMLAFKRKQDLFWVNTDVAITVK